MTTAMKPQFDQKEGGGFVGAEPAGCPIDLPARVEGGGEANPEAAGRGRLAKWLTSFSACGAYLSAIVHVVAYLIAVAIFYALGLQFLPTAETLSPPLVASLADEDFVDDAARLELTAEVSLGNTEQTSSAEQLAQMISISNNASREAMQTDALQSFSALDPADNAGGDAKSFMLKLPETGLAVTRGSFTAWTDPPNPSPGQNYLIVVEIRLPNDVQRYRLTDLNGDVTGTDQYKQKIPFDRNAPMASAASTPEGLKVIRGSESLEVVNNKVQLVIKVPGASRLVKDTIRIRSRRLREEQELELVFGQTQAKSASDKQPFE